MAGQGRGFRDSGQEHGGFAANKQGAVGEWNVMTRPHQLEESLSERLGRILAEDKPE